MFKNKDDKPVEVVHQLKLGNASVMLAFNQIINLFDIFFKLFPTRNSLMKIF